MPILYGLLNQRDLYDQRVTTTDVEVINTAITMSFAQWQEEMRLINTLFVMPTTKHQTKFLSVNSARLQPMDEAGQAKPVKPSGSYTRGFPIQMGGHAWGTDYVTSEKMTLQDVANNVITAQNADMAWMRDHVIAALTYKNGTAAWTFDDPEFGSLSIYGLANGDTQEYLRAMGTGVSSTDNHLFGSTTLTAAVFKNIKDEIKEHPENAGPIIAFIASDQVATAEALTGFIPVADEGVTLGANSDRLTGSLAMPYPGELIGWCEGVWVVEWKSLPDGYIIGVSTGGDKALAMREDVETNLRGFREVANRDNYPWYEKQFMRRAGFGAWNRVGAVVYLIGNATYSTPANYASPMA